MSLLYACLNVRKFVDDLDLLTVQRFFEDNPITSKCQYSSWKRVNKCNKEYACLLLVQTTWPKLELKDR